MFASIVFAACSELRTTYVAITRYAPAIAAGRDSFGETACSKVRATHALTLRSAFAASIPGGLGSLGEHVQYGGVLIWISRGAALGGPWFGVAPAPSLD